LPNAAEKYSVALLSSGIYLHEFSGKTLHLLMNKCLHICRGAGVIKSKYIAMISVIDRGTAKETKHFASMH
jgi:hypothetical protein